MAVVSSDLLQFESLAFQESLWSHSQREEGPRTMSGGVWVELLPLPEGSKHGCKGQLLPWLRDQARKVISRAAFHMTLDLS